MDHMTESTSMNIYILLSLIKLNFCWGETSWKAAILKTKEMGDHQN
jgi:hypothetical protein